MHKKRSLLLAFAFVALSLSLSSQTQDLGAKRTVTKTDRFDFGAGGTITVAGAPNGSIKIVGHAKNEVELVAEIQLQAANEADLSRIAEVTGFTLEETTANVRVISVGSHNKFGLKKLPKNFPKHLLTLPFTINYTLSVPRYSDLEIDGGKGELAIEGVEGSIRVNFLESNAKVNVVSGNTMVMIGSGSLDVVFGGRGWRGRLADIQIAKGDLSIALPTNLSAEIDASVLRSGSIENLFPDLKPRDRRVIFTEKNIAAKAGVGGAPMKFTVGEGNMRLTKLTQTL